MKPSQVDRAIRRCYRRNRPFILDGAPGGAKTDVASNAALTLIWDWEENGVKPDGRPLDLTVLHPVVDEPSTYKGQSWVVNDNGRSYATHLPYDEMQVIINSTRPHVVIFDDLGNALQSVQASLIHLFRARRIGKDRVSPFVRFCVLTNRKEDKCASLPMIESLKDRCKILHMTVDLPDVIEHAIKNAWYPMLVAFMRVTPKLLDDWKASNENKGAVTPRKLEEFSNELLYGEIDDDIRFETIAGEVGEGVASLYIGFENTYARLILAEDAIDDPEHCKLPTNDSEVYAIICSLAYKAKASNIDAIMKYASRLDREWTMVMLTDISKRDRELYDRSKAINAFLAEKRTQKMAGVRN